MFTSAQLTNYQGALTNSAARLVLVAVLRWCEVVQQLCGRLEFPAFVVVALVVLAACRLLTNLIFGCVVPFSVDPSHAVCGPCCSAFCSCGALLLLTRLLPDAAVARAAVAAALLLLLWIFDRVAQRAALIFGW
jgi:hypothetical protein